MSGYGAAGSGAAVSWGSVTGTLSSQTDLQTSIVGRTEPWLKTLQAGGSVIKSVMPGWSLPGVALTTMTMSDADAIFTAVWVPEDCTVTGVKWWQVTQGVYTADQTSQVGLYTYSGGTLTLVRSSADDTSLFKAASSSVGSKAFSSTYSATAGLYFIGLGVNWSSSSTAPALGARPIASASQQKLDTTNSFALAGVLISQNSLPASQAWSGITAGTLIPLVLLY